MTLNRKAARARCEFLQAARMRPNVLNISSDGQEELAYAKAALDLLDRCEAMLRRFPRHAMGATALRELAALLNDLEGSDG